MLCWGVNSPGGWCCFAANSFIVSGSPSDAMLCGGDLNATLKAVVAST